MTFPKINLHIHSNYSDGKNNVQEIVKGALELGLNYIAITDHFTNSWKAWVSTLKNSEKLSEYFKELSICQKFLKENNHSLKLIKGLEVDLSSSEKFIKTYINISEVDLILFEYLEDIESIPFIKKLIDYWEKSLLDARDLPLIGLAHFDPSNFLYGSLDLLINFLKEYNIYFEFNPRYSEFYSTQNLSFFEKVKENLIPVAVGCDSHTLGNLSNIKEPYEMISYYDLESNFQILLESLLSLTKY